MSNLKAEQEHTDKVKYWSEHPLDWFENMFSEAIAAKEIRLSGQQRQGFIELGKLLHAKLKMERGEKLVPIEKHYANKFGISIQSGNGTGKDAFAAWVILFFEYCFPDCKIPCTANSAKQLRNVLWTEIAKWMRLANKISPDSTESVLSHLFEWQAEKIYNKEDQGKGWFAEAVTINTKASDTEQAETIAGRHERFMLIVVDEASGIAEAVFNKFEATMTRPVNIMLLIYNPTRSKGYAVESQTSPHWIPLRWNAEESDIVDQTHVKRIEEKYGRDSNAYRIRVLGLPPLTDSDTLIPYDWIMDAVDRDVADIEPITVKGVDVGAGGDKSVVLTRLGGKITKIARHNTRDTMALVGHVSQEIEEDEPAAVMIDVIGIGKGVYDRLREVARKVYPVDVRRTPRNETRFQRMRDELWWTLRDQFEKGVISIPNDRDLIDQLSSIKWEPDSLGKIKIQSKKEMRSHGEHSPDEADALCLTYYMRDSAFRGQKEKPDAYAETDKKPAISWMGV